MSAARRINSTPGPSSNAVLNGCLALALGLVLVAVGTVSSAEEPPSLEQQVKAAFLAKFGLFVDWPQTASDPEPDAPFSIGILGQDPFGSSFAAATKDLHINGHPIRVERGRSVSELAHCRVVFIGSSESGRLEEVLAQLAGKPVLTVADEPEAAKRGVMINFFKENGEIRFELNPAAATRAGLTLSANLQQVGTIHSNKLAGGGH